MEFYLINEIIRALRKAAENKFLSKEDIDQVITDVYLSHEGANSIVRKLYDETYEFDADREKANRAIADILFRDREEELEEEK